MADPEHFIGGIYNYCDRWCERCPLTARCRLYAMQQRLDAADSDADNAAFWAALGAVVPPEEEWGDEELDHAADAGSEQDAVFDEGRFTFNSMTVRLAKPTCRNPWKVGFLNRCGTWSTSVVSPSKAIRWDGQTGPISPPNTCRS